MDIIETGSLSSTRFDAGRAERFAERLLGMLNEASLAIMTSIGHRTRLFDTMAAMPPSTVAAIAARAGLAERYVREWLAVMATSRVVDYDPTTGTYGLPVEHAAFLTRAATPDNIAVTAQHVSSIAAVENEIVARFADGKGVHYHHYPRFHEVMAEDSAQTVIAALFDRILPLVEGAKERLEVGIDVLDVGCGRGMALLKLARAYPKSRFLGLDLATEAVDWGNARAREAGLTNLRFEVCDLSEKESYGTFDLIFAFDAVHDQKDPQGLLDSIGRSLKSGGAFLMQDVGGTSRLERDMENPLGPFLYTISTMHCMPVSLAQGGPGLGTMWGEELAVTMLNSAGFEVEAVHRLPHDPFNMYCVARPRTR